MKILAPERMAKYDDYSIRTWGIPSMVLMENAGRSSYRLIKERYLQDGGRVVVFCGRGNNGGDGFVIARYALRDGSKTEVYLLCSRGDVKGDAALNMRLYESLGGRTIEIGDDAARFESAVMHAQVIVDAIFGTGLSKPLSDRDRAVVDTINRSGTPVVAVDIPSGIDGKTGRIMGGAVEASFTVTFGYPKPGHFLYPGAHHTGHLAVVDISLPVSAEGVLGYDGELIDGSLLRSFLRPRMPWDHKGTFGHAAVIAGSPGKTGAAFLSATGALRVGAGLVTLIVPGALNPILEAKTTEVMTLPVEDGGTGLIGPLAVDEILRFISDKDVVIIGPGLSQDEGTKHAVREIIARGEGPFVVDADGINAFHGALHLLRETGKEAVFTPHPGEIARLLGITPAEVNADRVRAGGMFVDETGLCLVLKGAGSLVFGPDGRLFFNPTGNVALAKGGSGDILTGFVGGFLAQGYTPLESALLGTYLHGYTADRWIDHGGSHWDLAAGDLLTGLGHAFRELESGKESVYVERSL